MLRFGHTPASKVVASFVLGRLVSFGGWRRISRSSRRQRIMLFCENITLFATHFVYWLLYNPNASYNRGFAFHTRTLEKNRWQKRAAALKVLGTEPGKEQEDEEGSPGPRTLGAKTVQIGGDSSLSEEMKPLLVLLQTSTNHSSPAQAWACHDRVRACACAWHPQNAVGAALSARLNNRAL